MVVGEDSEIGDDPAPFQPKKEVSILDLAAGRDSWNSFARCDCVIMSCLLCMMAGRSSVCMDRVLACCVFWPPCEGGFADDP